MIIFWYLLKEVVKTQVAVFLVVMTIFISNQLMRELSDASDGSIPGQLVMIFVGLSIPYLAGIILPLSLFLGVLLAYGRIYADNEMSVMHACGVSEWYVTRVTLVVSFVTAIITGTFTMYLAPMAIEYEYQVKDQLLADSGLSSLMAGRFQQTGNKKAVVFVHDKNRDDNSLEKVFMALLPDSDAADKSIINSSLVYAQKGKIVQEDSGSQILVLDNGMRYQNDSETNQFQSVEFGEYRVEIEEQPVEQRRRKLGAIPLDKLMSEDTPEAIAEVQMRIAFPISVIILTLIAVPLSVVNPRQGKFAKMLPALLLFLGYYLILSTGRSALEDEVYPKSIGLWPIHVSALIMGWLLLMNNRPAGYKLKAMFWRRAA